MIQYVGNGMSSIFSDCGKYRHELRIETSRISDQVDHPLVAVGANPSQAGKKVDGKIRSDHTARRLLAFAEREKATHLIIVNGFDYIETDPNKLPDHSICSDENNGYIQKAFQECRENNGILIFCWGDCIKFTTDRFNYIHSLANYAGVQPLCFGYTKKGNPRHPLRLLNNQPLINYIGNSK